MFCPCLDVSISVLVYCCTVDVTHPDLSYEDYTQGVACTEETVVVLLVLTWISVSTARDTVSTSVSVRRLVSTLPVANPMHRLFAIRTPPNGTKLYATVSLCVAVVSLLT